jgi:endonuclease YncB( thermonuclease family)
MRILLTFALVLCAAASFAEEFQGHVIYVGDGSTITVVNLKGQQLRVSLAGIDAPRRGQAFFKQSTDNLTKLTRHKKVLVQWHRKDRYGRLVGMVSLDGRDISLEQIRAGCAWRVPEYASEQTRREQIAYEKAEKTARAQRLGLWLDPSPVAPWEWQRP